MSNYKLLINYKMTEQDFLNIIGNKISNEMQKAIIRRNYAPEMAELLCIYLIKDIEGIESCVVKSQPKDDYSGSQFEIVEHSVQLPPTKT